MQSRRDEYVRRLAEACRRGDVDEIHAVLDAEATAVCDGGGVVAAIGPIHSAGDVAHLAVVLLREGPDTELTIEAVNGRPGLALRRAGRAVAVVAVEAADTGITALWVVLNPAKLHRWHSIRTVTG